MSSSFNIYGGTITKYAYTTGGSLGDITAKDITSIPISWTDKTVLSTTFNTDALGNETIVGSNFSGEIDNVSKYRIFKTIGESTALYDLGTIDANGARIFDDFLVGNSRQSTYYIFPIFEENGVEMTKSPIISNSVECEFGSVSVIGLNRLDENVYEVDYDNIWHFGLNITYGGLALNADKVFTDGLGQFPSANIGKRNYFTGQSVSGLIGRIDGNSSKYIDSADLIEEWRTFSVNGRLKLFRDSRGVIFPCDIKDVSYSYGEGTGLIYVSFVPVQITDLKNITIQCKQQDIDLTMYKYLADNSGTRLYSTENDENSKSLVVPIRTRDVDGN